MIVPLIVPHLIFNWNFNNLIIKNGNLQDRFVGLLRGIATDYGPHVTIVVHPRKTDVNFLVFYLFILLTHGAHWWVLVKFSLW